MPVLNKPRKAATASTTLMLLELIGGDAPAQKYQHPRQIDPIILSTFASSRSIEGSVPSGGPFMGCSVPDDGSAVPDELVPGAPAVCRRRRPLSRTCETIPCHALPCRRRGQTPGWLKRQRKGPCEEREGFHAKTFHAEIPCWFSRRAALKEFGLRRRSTPPRP